MIKQRTLQNSIKATGIGLHTGQKVYLTLKPAPINNGIVFRRVDLDPVVEIQACTHNVADTTLSTNLGKDGIRVATVEHLLSAMAGLGIDNAYVELSAEEVPIMDGSSKPFVEMIEEIGIKKQSKKRKLLNVKKSIEVTENNTSVKIVPNNQFSIDFEIDFPSKIVSKQSCQLQLINGNYKTDIAAARTFGFEKDVKYLRSNGLALGGSLDNAVVVGENEILNKDGLRYTDEFVRHKI